MRLICILHITRISNTKFPVLLIKREKMVNSCLSDGWCFCISTAFWQTGWTDKPVNKWWAQGECWCLSSNAHSAGAAAGCNPFSFWTNAEGVTSFVRWTQKSKCWGNLVSLVKCGFWDERISSLVIDIKGAFCLSEMSDQTGQFVNWMS